MRVFLDECVDRRLARHIPGHEVKTARQMGWTAVVVLCAKSNRLAELAQVAPKFVLALDVARIGVVTTIGET